MRGRTAIAALMLALLASAGGALQRSDFRLPGPIVGGAVGGGQAWLLVESGVDGGRQLLELRMGDDAAQLSTRIADLPSTAETLALGRVAESAPPMVFLADGARLIAIDPGSPAARHEVYSGPGRLLRGARSGPFATPAPWLVAARAGEAYPLTMKDGMLQAGAAQALPVTAALERWGLHLTSPAAAFAGDWLAVGPQQEGTHLRTVALGATGERRECTSELPSPEHVAESTLVVLDGRPTLVAGTFQGLGVMSRKLLRVFALVADAGAPPRRPMLATQLEARAWQDLEVRAGDYDADGRDDLAIASAEGLGEGSVTVTIFRGLGGGRLRSQPFSASYGVKDASWRYGADVSGDHIPDLVTLGGGRLEIHAGGAPVGLPAKKPTLTIAVKGTEAPTRRVTAVSIGSGGTKTEQRTEAAPAAAAATPAPSPAPSATAPPPQESPRWELIDVDGDGKAELLWWGPEDDGHGTHLIVLRF